MKRITVTQVLTIASGVIAISEDQYRRRSHNLELIGMDNNEQLALDEEVMDLLEESKCVPCRVVRPVMFKVGEVLFLGEVPKSMNPSFKTDADIEADEQEAAEAAERDEVKRKEAAEQEEADRIEAEQEAETKRQAREKTEAEEAEKAEAKLKDGWAALTEKQRAEYSDGFEGYKIKLASAAKKKAPKKKAPNKKK